MSTASTTGKTSSKWLPLESNPEMLTQFLRSLGVKSPCRFVDIWSFDEDTITMFPQPIIAVCVLYPPDEVEQKRKSELSYLPPNGQNCFFVRQRLVSPL
jgi:ubiquitin carboxyl-terminal hydrolase L3